MPYINIKLGGIQLNDSQRENIQSSMTHLMKTIMKKKAEVTTVQIEETPSRNWSVNSLSQDNSIISYVDIKITENTNSDEEKAKLIFNTNSLLTKELGSLAEASYTVIHEIPSGNWGYDGKTQKERFTGK